MSFAWRKEHHFIEEAKKLMEWHPFYENEIIFWFGIRLEQKGLENLAIIFRSPIDFPDAILANFDTGEALNVEFEVKSSGFKPHITKYGEKAVEVCDLIVCAKHDWDSCPIDVYNVISDSFHKAKKRS